MKAVLLVLVLLALPFAAAPVAGDVYVDRVPDKAFTLVMQGASFNGLSYPDTPLLEAAVGERVQVTVVAGTEAHTFHMHGHPWLVPSKYGFVDTFLVDAADTHSFQIVAGGVDHESGDWMYHCHIDAHMAAGMWGIFRVYPFSTTILPQPGGFLVHLDRLGEPVDKATLAATLDDAPLPMHVVPLGKGDYLVHADATRGVLVVKATSPAWGESVGRAGLGGVGVPTPTLRADGPAGAATHAHGG